jgi:electron transfer flavoprotein beta subunit
LGVPHVTDVEWLEATETEVTVRRQLGGSVQTLRVPLPAVLTVTRELNVPRLPSIAGVLRAEEATVDTYDAREAGADEALCGLKGSPTQVVQTYLPQRTRVVQEITDIGALLDIIKGGATYGTDH